jgi:hypothetical protein
VKHGANPEIVLDCGGPLEQSNKSPSWPFEGEEQSKQSEDYSDGRLYHETESV